MKPHRPAPRTGAPSANANRIRERYLHQLGLQRGSQPQGPLAPPTQHVVVIGLPSLPEERESNEPTSLQLESHDFSNLENKGGSSQQTADSEIGDFREHAGDEASDSGSSHKMSRGHSPTTSVGNELTVPITSLALSYPTALLKSPPVANEGASTTPNRSISSITRWFSKPAAMQPDFVKSHVNDQDSVTSTATSTTAGSSFTTMVSRDWGATAPAQNLDPLGTENNASSAVFLGVHFQCGHPRVLGNNTGLFTTSSLTYALNKFNIDSDCDASIASGSVAGGGNSIMTEDEDNNIMDEDDASVHSHASFISLGSPKSHISSTRARGRKAGKAQRLLDRAAAHERILHIRNEQSQKTRASLIQSQRMGHPLDTPETRSRSSSTSSQSSIPLVHVQYGSTNQVHDVSLKLPAQSSPYGGDLSRTPTASNCSDLRKLKGLRVPTGLFYQGLNCSIPAGVHVLFNTNQEITSNNENNSTSVPTSLDTVPGKPLGFHPQLASRIPPAPPQVATTATSPEDVTPNSTSLSGEAQESFRLFQHRRQKSVDDVLEVVEALSKLKGRGKVSGTMIPRVR